MSIEHAEFIPYSEAELSPETGCIVPIDPVVSSDLLVEEFALDSEEMEAILNEELLERAEPVLLDLPKDTPIPVVINNFYLSQSLLPKEKYAISRSLTGIVKIFKAHNSQYKGFVDESNPPTISDLENIRSTVDTSHIPRAYCIGFVSELFAREEVSLLDPT